MARFIDIETPYSGSTDPELIRNLIYARACINDSLKRGEVPFASHLFYTQPGILDDTKPEERKLGINAGKELIEALPNIVTVVYQNYGISEGMKYGIEHALENGRDVEYRCLEDGWENKSIDVALSHAHAKIWGVMKISLCEKALIMFLIN